MIIFLWNAYFKAWPNFPFQDAPEKKSKHSGKANRFQNLDIILANLKGKPDFTFDHSQSDKIRRTYSTLSVSNSRELFNRLACKDFLYLKTLPIKAAFYILPLLLPQSICGRAQNGHGMFFDEQGRPLRFPDATIDDVILAIGSEELGIPNHLVKVHRQKILENLERFLLESVSSKKVAFGSAESSQSNPLGIIFLEGISVDAEPFFKGFVLGGMMDNWKKRRLTAKHFKVTLRGEPLILGGGELLLANPEKFTKVGLTEQIAANKIFSDEEIRSLRELEVIVDETYGNRHPKPVGIFFRRMAGPGVSDDAAIVYIGKTYGTDAMYGVLLADAADTYDKYVDTYVEGGHDENMVNLISKHLARGGPFVSDQEIWRLIYLSAKANDPPLDISSSHRRLIQIEHGSRIPTFLNHVTFVEGGKPAQFPMGYNRFDSNKFYDGISQRAEILRLDW